MKLYGMKEITGKIILKTGLHIGSGDTEMKIGGTDNSVLKHPYTQEPYIPGSSLKGKVRSLLEMRSGLMGATGGNPLSIKNLTQLEGKEKQECEKILKLFGSSGTDIKGGDDLSLSLGPTRVSFADCSLDLKWKEEAFQKHWPFTEVKSENAINRIKGTAENPRFTERVPADTKFTFSISLKRLGDEDDLEVLLLEGLKLLQKDSLGGNGSRGYGRILFEFDDSDLQKKFDEIKPV